MAYKTIRGGLRGLGALGNPQGMPYSDLNGLGRLVFKGQPPPRPRPLVAIPDRFIPGPLTRTIQGNAALTMTAPGVSSLRRLGFRTAGVSGLPAAPGSSVMPAPAPAGPVGPPADGMKITDGLVLDLKRGDMWVGVTKIAIVAAVLSAITVKVVMFGGAAGGNALRSAFKRKSATA